MKIFTPIRTFVLVAVLSLVPQFLFAGDGTKENPYTVVELNAQKDALAASGATVWVKADLKGLGEDGNLTENTESNQMAGLFGDATGNFVAYSYQILQGLAVSDLTNKENLLISLTYGTTGHPHGSSASPQYATNYEPTTAHFSLAEVHGALTLNITNGYRGYHIPSCYIIPQDIVAIKVGAGYSSTKGAYVNCDNVFDGATQTYVTPKNSSLVLLAEDGNHDIVLSAALYEQPISNGNTMFGGTQAGLNKYSNNKTYCFRFIANGEKVGFERNSDNTAEVTLASKDEVYLYVSNSETNFWGNWTWETTDKKWISWNGKKYSDYHAPAPEVTFDFENNNMNMPIGTPENTNAGNLGGKSITINGVSLSFVNSMTMPTRYYFNAGKNQLQAIAGGQLRFTAPEGKAITKIEITPVAATNNKWGVDGEVGTLSEDKLSWEGNVTTVRFTATGALYLTKVVVTTSDKNDATVTPPDTDSYTEVSSLAEFNALAKNTLAKLTLNNAIITSSMVNDWGYYVQDATAGAHFYCTGLTFDVNDVINGFVYVKKDFNQPGPRITMTEKTNAANLAVSHGGTYTPIEGTLADVVKAGNNNMVIKLTDVAVKGSSTTEATITSGEQTLLISNGTTNYAPYVYKEDLTSVDYAKATVVGILWSNTAGNTFKLYPLSITNNDPSGIDTIHGDSAERVVIYNLSGQRVEHPTKGVYIKNGIKVVIK